MPLSIGRDGAAPAEHDFAAEMSSILRAVERTLLDHMRIGHGLKCESVRFDCLPSSYEAPKNSHRVRGCDGTIRRLS
jgi:hypothetical protein